MEKSHIANTENVNKTFPQHKSIATFYFFFLNSLNNLDQVVYLYHFKNMTNEKKAIIYSKSKCEAKKFQILFAGKYIYHLIKQPG